jgi:hypothetical protein
MRRANGLVVEDIACGGCAIGRASGEGRGQFCPFIARRHRPGEVLCKAGDPVSRVWFVKDGIVGLSRSRDAAEVDEVDAIVLPGGMVGLECLVGRPHPRTARALSNVRLCGAPRDEFLAWLRQSDERVASVMRAALDDPLLGGRREVDRSADLARIVRAGPG